MPFRLLALFITTLLASCIEGREEFWIHPNGSGRAEVSYDVPAIAASLHGGESGIRDLINDLLDECPDLTRRDVRVHTENDRLLINLKLAFPSALDLVKIAQGDAIQKVPASAQHLLGTLDFHLSGRTATVARELSPGRAIPGVRFIPKSQLAGRSLTYITHLPLAAESSNATRTANDGKTLIWEFPLAKALNAPVSTRFVAKVPIPWWLVAGTGGSLAFIGWLGITFIRRRKRNANPPSPAEP